MLRYVTGKSCLYGLVGLLGCIAVGTSMAASRHLAQVAAMVPGAAQAQRQAERPEAKMLAMLSFLPGGSPPHNNKVLGGGDTGSGAPTG